MQHPFPHGSIMGHRQDIFMLRASECGAGRALSALSQTPCLQLPLDVTDGGVLTLPVSELSFVGGQDKSSKLRQNAIACRCSY